MPKYCDTFKLSPTDVDIIENAIRKVMHLEYSTTDSEQLALSQKSREVQDYIRSLNEVLGKIHNQKVFYGQVNDTGVPTG